jgi:hypothetical protein
MFLKKETGSSSNKWRIVCYTDTGTALVSVPPPHRGAES